MELEVKKFSEKEIVIIVKGEGHTLGNLIAKQAMKHPHVIFASYRIPHPLQDRMEITIIVDKEYSIDKALKDIVYSIKNVLDEFKKNIEALN